MLSYGSWNLSIFRIGHLCSKHTLNSIFWDTSCGLLLLSSAHIFALFQDLFSRILSLWGGWQKCTAELPSCSVIRAALPNASRNISSKWKCPVPLSGYTWNTKTHRKCLVTRARREERIRPLRPALVIKSARSGATASIQWRDASQRRTSGVQCLTGPQ